MAWTAGRMQNQERPGRSIPISTLMEGFGPIEFAESDMRVSRVPDEPRRTRAIPRARDEHTAAGSR